MIEVISHGLLYFIHIKSSGGIRHASGDGGSRFLQIKLKKFSIAQLYLTYFFDNREFSGSRNQSRAGWFVPAVIDHKLGYITQ